MLSDLLKSAKKRNLITSDIDYVALIRNMFAHGSDDILDAPMVLTTFAIITGLIKELYAPARLESSGID